MMHCVLNRAMLLLLSSTYCYQSKHCCQYCYEIKGATKVKLKKRWPWASYFNSQVALRCSQHRNGRPFSEYGIINFKFFSIDFNSLIVGMDLSFCSESVYINALGMVFEI